MTRIDGLNSLATARTQHGQGAGAADSNAHAADAGGTLEGPQDRVNLSNRGRIVAEAARAVGNAPDTRAEKVLALRAAIAGGTYRAGEREIAERLLQAGFGA